MVVSACSLINGSRTARNVKREYRVLQVAEQGGSAALHGKIEKSTKCNPVKIKVHAVPSTDLLRECGLNASSVSL